MKTIEEIGALKPPHKNGAATWQAQRRSISLRPTS